MSSSSFGRVMTRLSAGFGRLGRGATGSGSSVCGGGSSHSNRRSSQGQVGLGLGLRFPILRYFTGQLDPKAQQIREKLMGELEAVHVDLEDKSGGCGDFFQLTVVSEQFEGKSRLMRHRLVTSALKDEIKEIHGLTLKTETPSQFEASKSAGGK